MSPTERYRPLAVVIALSAVSGIAGLLWWALLSLPPQATGLAAAVREYLPQSGVRAEVTAVLLNFRGYDTLLELAVLLAALLAAWQLGRMQVPRSTRRPGPVVETLVRLLVPVTVVVTGYVLWLGSHAAGGAFQAGALLAGAGVLLLVASADTRLLQDRAVLRVLLVAGPAVFALIAGVLLFSEGALLRYPPGFAGGLILLIEAVSVVSIGLILTLLFAGGRPPGGKRQ